jgi:acyl dehydratase
MLYALAAGAGADDLPYIYEALGPRLLPTFGAFVTGPWMPAVSRELHNDRLPVLYAGFEYFLHGPIAPNVTARTEAVVTGVEINARSMRLWISTRTRTDAGMLLVSGRHCHYVQLAGTITETLGQVGYTDTSESPTGEPDRSISVDVDERASLLYHLLLPLDPDQPISDRFHVDPAAARERGLPSTLLHGPVVVGHLGLALARVLRNELEDARIAGFGARFAGPAFPGDRFNVALWRPAGEGGRWLVRVTNASGEAVLTGGWINLERTTSRRQ